VEATMVENTRMRAQAKAEGKKLLAKGQAKVASVQRVLDLRALPFGSTWCLDLLALSFGSTLCLDLLALRFGSALCLDLQAFHFGSTLCLDLLPVMFWIYNLFGSTSGILDLWTYSFSRPQRLPPRPHTYCERDCQVHRHPARLSLCSSPLPSSPPLLVF
jgi:hypothetical protein